MNASFSCKRNVGNGVCQLFALILMILPHAAQAQSISWTINNVTSTTIDASLNYDVQTPNAYWITKPKPSWYPGYPYSLLHSGIVNIDTSMTDTCLPAANLTYTYTSVGPSPTGGCAVNRVFDNLCPGRQYMFRVQYYGSGGTIDLQFITTDPDAPYALISSPTITDADNVYINGEFYTSGATTSFEVLLMDGSTVVYSGPGDQADTISTDCDAIPAGRLFTDLEPGKTYTAYTIATNSYGTDTSSAYMFTVPNQLVVHRQPQPDFVCEGNDHTLSVLAQTVNPESISYQWYKNDTVLTGATDSVLTLANATAADTGHYHCLLTVPTIGTTSTDTVFLAHTTPPTVSVSYMHENCAATLDLTVSGAHGTWLATAPRDTVWASNVLGYSSYFDADQNHTQVLGPPNVYPAYGDLSYAWAPATPDDQREWIEVSFAPTMANQVLVYETWNTGAIDTLYVRYTGDASWTQVWSNTAKRGYGISSVLQVDLPLKVTAVEAVRLAINSPAVTSWNEYDAIGLVSWTCCTTPTTTASGTQTITIVDTAGCIATDTVSLPTIQTPQLTADLDLTDCEAQVTLNVADVNGSSHVTVAGMEPDTAWAGSVLGYSSQYNNHNYSAAQTLGQPDVYPSYGDFTSTWATATADGQREWIELGYTAMEATQIDVYQTLAPGAIDTVYVRYQGNSGWTQVWSATAAAGPAVATILTVPLPQSAQLVESVRLAINSPAVSNWNEIDAVALVDCKCTTTSFAYTDPGTHTYTLFDDYGCRDTAQVTVPAVANGLQATATLGGTNCVAELQVEVTGANGGVSVFNDSTATDTLWATGVIGYSSQFNSSGYAAVQATGAPDIYPAYGDLAGSWTGSTANGQREWIELSYTPTLAQQLLVYQTFTPGAIDTVYVRYQGDAAWTTIWSGAAAPAATVATVFEVALPESGKRVNAVRLALNNPAVNNWNEIDAVGLVDCNCSTTIIGLAPGTHTWYVEDDYGCRDTVQAAVPAFTKPQLTTTTATGDCQTTISLGSSGTNTDFTLVVDSAAADTAWASSVLGYSSQYNSHNYSAAQTLGAPDIYPAYGDYTSTWATATADGQREWIELGYTPIAATHIEVYQTLAPGAIDTVYVRYQGQTGWTQVWSGTAAPGDAVPTIFTAELPATNAHKLVEAVRLAVNSPAVGNWNEIDAEALVNCDCRATEHPGLPAGQHTVYLTDGYGCADTATVTVSVLDNPAPIITADTLPSCDGSNPGTLTASATGGGGSFGWLWASGDTVATRTGLNAGSYALTVTDGNGCTGTALHDLHSPCEVPVNTVTKFISDTSATLQWDTVCGATSYLIRWKVPGTTGWNKRILQVAKSATLIDGLSASSHYVWTVQAKCNDVWGSISARNRFSTLSGPCAAPATLSAAPVQSTQARLNWTAPTLAKKVRIRYRAAGTSSWTVVVVSAPRTKKWITGLAPGTTYEWQIKSGCEFGPSSGGEWSAMQTFSAPSSKWHAATDYRTAMGTGLQVFPNPNRGQFNVVLPAGVQQARILVTDLAGRLIAVHQFFGEGSLEMDLGDVPTGVYLVRVEGLALPGQRIVVLK